MLLYFFVVVALQTKLCTLSHKKSNNNLILPISPFKLKGRDRLDMVVGLKVQYCRGKLLDSYQWDIVMCTILNMIVNCKVVCNVSVSRRNVFLQFFNNMDKTWNKSYLIVMFKKKVLIWTYFLKRTYLSRQIIISNLNLYVIKLNW